MKAYEIIKECLDKRGLKQNAVAKNIGIPVELFSRTLRGERKFPADEFVRCCIFLELELSDFKTEQGNLQEVAN